MQLRRAVDIAVGVLIGAAVAALGPADADHTWDATWDKQTVTVETEPGIDVAGAVAPWNELAGRQMLAPVRAGSRADVLLSPSTDGRSRVKWQHDGGVMLSCRILYGTGESRATYVLQHEMGHCLGFVDHVLTGDRWQRRQCADPQAPNYSAYRGVMAYCGFRDPAYRAWRWFGPADVDMFRRTYP